MIMNATEILKNIRALFNEAPIVAPVAAPVVAPVEAAPVQFSDYNLKDGTVVSIDKLEIGGAVMAAGVPVTDGEYIMADDSTITVVGGIITEIKPMEVVEPVELQVPDPRIAQLFAENKKIKESFMQLLSVVESMVKLPAAEPLEAKKTIFTEAQINRADKFKALQNTIQNLKK
jgi:hypothetical protein